MTEKEYNGWTNYETWLVKLWMDNEQGSYEYWQGVAEQHFQEHGSKEVHLLMGHLKEQHEEALPKVSGFVADLLNAAMSEVNWHEIANSLLQDAKEVLTA